MSIQLNCFNNENFHSQITTFFSCAPISGTIFFIINIFKHFQKQSILQNESKQIEIRIKDQETSLDELEASRRTFETFDIDIPQVTEIVSEDQLQQLEDVVKVNEERIEENKRILEQASRFADDYEQALQGLSDEQDSITHSNSLIETKLKDLSKNFKKQILYSIISHVSLLALSIFLKMTPLALFATTILSFSFGVLKELKRLDRILNEATE